MNTDSKPELPDEIEVEIHKLSLAPTSASLDSRMATLFADAPVSAPVSASVNSKNRQVPRWLATSLSIAASLLIGFGAGAWYGRSEAANSTSTSTVTSTDGKRFVDETKLAGQPLDGLSNVNDQTSELPRTQTVSRNTTLSAPLWLESKDGRVFRSYLANTQEDIVEIDPATQKKKLVQRHTPRLVISNSPGI